MCYCFFLEQLAESVWRLNSNLHLRLYLLPSFWVPVLPPNSFICATVRIPVTRSHCDEELPRNQSDMIRFTFQIDVASIESGRIACITSRTILATKKTLSIQLRQLSKSQLSQLDTQQLATFPIPLISDRVSRLI